MSKLAKSDIINVLVIIAIWVIMVILVNPIGDFPLNDDWAYGYSVKVLLEQGDFQLSGWTATNLLTQVLWGALFCLPFGFSFTALRFSTLTLGLIGVLATYGLLREINTNSKLSLVGALVVAVNPLYFGLSHTFMNDVHFFGLAILSLYLFVRGLNKDSKAEIVIGTIVACITVLTRQVGLVIPLAYGCAYIFKKGITIRNGIRGFLPAFIGLSTQVFYQKWLQITMRAPDKYGNQFKTLFHEILKGFDNLIVNFATVTVFSLIYLGLFLFPFLLLLFTLKKENIFQGRRKLFFLVSLGSLVTLKLLTSQHQLMPLFRGHVLTDFGIGPVILKNSEFPKAPQLFWFTLTVLGIIGAALLIQYLFLAVWQILAKNQESQITDRRWSAVLGLSAIFIYFIPLGFMGLGAFGFYDRYLIFLLPLLMMVASVSTTSIRNWKIGYGSISVAVIMMLLYGGFTIGATHDYLSWNRMRWQALRDLMQEEQVSPSRIDGGFEFNGWYLYSDDYDDWKDEHDKSWYWVDKDDYVVSFNPLTGYEEVKLYSFSKWLPWGQGNILVLHKNSI